MNISNLCGAAYLHPRRFVWQWIECEQAGSRLSIKFVTWFDLIPKLAIFDWRTYHEMFSSTVGESIELEFKIIVCP